MDIEELDNRLEILMWKNHGDLINKLSELGGGISNKFHNWTPLKLIGLSYFAGGYANILSSLKKKFPDLKIIYIDLFAGSGLNCINGTYFAGSPLVCIDSVRNRRTEMDKMYFNDNNNEYCNALKKRLEYLESIDEFSWISNNYEILNLDCNEAMNSIIENIKNIGFQNFLAFIDPYRIELSWNCLENLLSIPYGDIMISFQAKLIAKDIGRYRENQLTDSKDKIQQFLGEEDQSVIIKLDSEEKIKNYYIDKISRHRKFIRDIEIKSGGGYRYFIIFASRKEDPPWGKYIDKMKKFIESYNGDLVEHSIDYLTCKQLRLI